jgi:hypothetical protein
MFYVHQFQDQLNFDRMLSNVHFVLKSYNFASLLTERSNVVPIIGYVAVNCGQSPSTLPILDRQP